MAPLQNAVPDANMNDEDDQMLHLDDLAEDEGINTIGDENQDYGNEDMDADEEADRLQAEETVLNNHLECVKQEAYLITVEGEIITKLENGMMNDE